MSTGISRRDALKTIAAGAGALVAPALVRGQTSIKGTGEVLVASLGGSFEDAQNKGVFLPFIHRPLSRYVNAMLIRGLSLIRMDEPAPPPGFLAIAPEYPESNTIPRLLVLLAERR